MEDLRGLVEEATVDTPYTVTPRDKGFDVGLDLADARWHTVLGQAGLKKTYVHEVRPRGDAGYAITDVSKSLDWVAGAPGLAAGFSMSKGRAIEFGAEKVWGLDEHGRLIPVANFSFRSGEGRQLITLAGDQLGLRQRRSKTEMGALAMAAFTLGGLLLAGVVLLVLAALGKL